jgi:hypothetical protein
MDWFPYIEPYRTEEEMDEGAERADMFVSYLARDQDEVKFLDALSVGHTFPNACRLSGLTRYKANLLLDHCKESLEDLQSPA